MLASRRQVTGVALAVAVAACSGGRSDTGRQAAAAPSPGTGGSTAALSPGAPVPGGEAERVNVGDLGKEPSRFVGRRVTVEGPVANVLSESALAIGEQGAGPGRGLLVLVPNRAQVLPQHGRVTVSGPVRLYDRSQLRAQYGFMASTPELDARYAGQPVVIAESLRAADGHEVAGAASGQLPAGSGEAGLRGGPPGTDHDRQPPQRR